MNICKTGACRNFEFISASCEKCASKKEVWLVCGKGQLWPVGNVYVLDAALPGNF